MGILNCTPDSFFDGQESQDLENQIKKIHTMIHAGATIIDIGGESTRPQASFVTQEEELSRIIEIVQVFKKQFPDTLLSIDTRKSFVALACQKFKIDIINDVSGLRFDPQMVDLLVGQTTKIVLTHSRGTPENMNQKERYPNGVENILVELDHQISFALQKGVSENQIWIDPGIGFAKDTLTNIQVLKSLPQLKEKFGYPLLVGLSRKRFLGEMTQTPKAADRLEASLIANFFAAIKGADILRVHDVKQTHQMLKLYSAFYS